MSVQLVAETSNLQHTTLTTDINAPCGDRTHNPSNQADADLHLRRTTTGIGCLHSFRRPNVTSNFLGAQPGVSLNYVHKISGR